MSTNSTPHPVFLAANENCLIKAEYRQIADALIAAQQCASIPGLRESLQNAIAIFTSQEAPLPPYYVIQRSPDWMEDILLNAGYLTQSFQNKATRATINFDEESLLGQLRYCEPYLRSMNDRNFVNYRCQRASTEHLTVKYTTLCQFTAHDNPIISFIRFRTYATPEEIRIFFDNFMYAIRRVFSMTPPFPQQIHEVRRFLRACARIYDEAFLLSLAYANPHSSLYVSTMRTHPYYIRVFLEHLAAQGEQEGLQYQRRRRLAFAMGAHPRLGAGSLARTLAGLGDLVRFIVLASE